MNNSEITKQKIIETEKLLQDATEQAETLPEQAGLLLAEGKEVEGNKLFEQAITSSQNVKKYSAMLNALKRQFTEHRELEKSIRVENEIKQIESDVKKNEAVFKKKLEAVISAFNDLVNTPAPSSRLSSYSGGHIAGRFFDAGFRGGMYQNSFIPAKSIDESKKNFLETYTDAILQSAKIEIKREVN